MNLSEVRRSYIIGRVPVEVEKALKRWIGRYPTVSNAISSLLLRRKEINAKYTFIERRAENVCDLRIETNVKDMKSLFRSLKQLQTAFDQSPYKSIDFFLEILLFGGQSTILHFAAKKPKRQRQVRSVAIQIKEDKGQTPPKPPPLPTAVNINIKPELPKQVKVSIQSAPAEQVKKQVKIRVIPTTVVTVINKPTLSTPSPVGIPLVVDMSKRMSETGEHVLFAS